MNTQKQQDSLSNLNTGSDAVQAPCKGWADALCYALAALLLAAEFQRGFNVIQKETDTLGGKRNAMNLFLVPVSEEREKTKRKRRDLEALSYE